MRLRRVEEEFAGAVRVEWRSFLLRPAPDPGVTLERFRAYTRSWLRPAADPDGGTFRVWATDAGPPSHSIPPHLVAKAAATIGEDAFQRIHARLLHAYFADNRDITDTATLEAVWRESGLPAAAFARAADPALLRATVAEHDDAVERGITSVPTVMLEGQDVWVPGAQPFETYRRWLARVLGR